jgi:diacylglycerol kinase family enzyme
MADGAPRALTIIANAAARSNGAQQMIESLGEQCRALGLAAQVVPVRDGEQILAATRSAVQRGHRIVVAAGGDGTVSAVASCLAATGVSLGVLPLGTLNHFAKDLGIPLETGAALQVIARGRTVDIDLGEVNGRLFINNSSLGLYPRIVRDRELQQRYLGRGKWRALLTASLHALRRYPVLSVDIDVNGERLQRRSAFVFIGNNEYHMEGFEIGERAQLSAGELSLYVTQRTGRFGLLRLALRALTGRLEQARDFDMLTATSFTVRPHQRRIRVATDGELQLLATPLHYRIRPACLRVIVPAAAE